MVIVPEYSLCLCSSFRQGKSLPAPSTSEDTCNYKLQGHFTECRYFLSLSAIHPGYSCFQIMVTVAPDWPEIGMVGLTVTSIRSADRTKNAQACLFFQRLKFFQRYCNTWMVASHAISGFLMQLACCDTSQRCSSKRVLPLWSPYFPKVSLKIVGLSMPLNRSKVIWFPFANITKSLLEGF